MFFLHFVQLLMSCEDKMEECPVIAEEEGRLLVGFWENDDCSGDPVTTNSFPISSSAECYCWPGNSGENSADDFSCNADEESFTYTQYGSLDCGVSDNTPTTKTVYTNTCTEDIPPTLHAMILDYSPCQ